MKRLFLFVLLMCLITHAGAQSNDQKLIRRKATPRAKACPRAYIGFSTGINNASGFLGPQVDIAITPSVSIGSGFGLSTWGIKTFLETRYYFDPCNRGWAIGAGFTYNTGRNGLILPEIKTIYGAQEVVVDQYSQANFMLSGYYFFNLGHRGRNRFHLQAGYSIPLTERGRYDTDLPLTAEGRDQIFYLSPGGIIIGLGFSFGVGSM